jgi:MoxR-vWA-beta-propeller ternary system domain bpX4
MKAQSPFLDTLFLLRQEECITIFTDLQEISRKEENDAAEYLETEFEKERLEFLFDTISYDKEAAVWAAKVLYHSAQLYLIRENTAKDLNRLIPPFNGKRDASAILSADLSLRFLPQIILALQQADPEDQLIKLLENILTEFHYSAVGFNLELENINWEKELSDMTYRKLYFERIVEKKVYSLAELPFINRLLIAEFGMYKEVFWKELKNMNK